MDFSIELGVGGFLLFQVLLFSLLDCGEIQADWEKGQGEGTLSSLEADTIC